MKKKMLRQSLMKPILIVLAIYLSGCSTSSSDAPRTDQAHPPRYLLSHSAKAEADLYSCQSCHGLDLTGNGNPVPGCLSCHDSGPPFSIHPLPYTDAADHGPAARADQLLCRGCHGKPLNNFAGGVVADPKLFNNPAGSCSAAACHPTARAHPTNWQGTNDDRDPSYDATHRTISLETVNTSCVLCHKTNGSGFGPLPDAPSCFSANFTNSDGITTGCHADGPGFTAPHDLPYTDADDHGAEAKADLVACQQCHGIPGTIQFNGNTAATSCSTAQCHRAADAHPTNWQGTNDATIDYLSSHRNALKQDTTCTICHDFTQGRTAPNPAAPSCFTTGFTNADGSTTGCHSSGPGAPHTLPFTDSALHGPQAKADLKYCQECHAAPSAGGPGSNPRFNVAVGDLVNGCEDCHPAETAHPYPSWSGAASNSHKTAGNLDIACTLCHGATLQGPAEDGVGKACDDCHTAGSPQVLTNCTSCHNDPPDSAAPAGNFRPNRDGSHSVHDSLPRVVGICSTCHNGTGTNTNIHFDTSTPASVAGLTTYDAKSGVFSYSPAGRTCANVSCHGGRTTPDWLNSTLKIATACKSCHLRGTSQYNSYNSGKHEKHVKDKKLFCTECHDPAKLASDHFIRLDTPGFEGAADATIRDALSYDPATNRGCSVAGCHGTEKWF
ncbi:MAG: CxxxxCH/CxxCH domain-containing protein [bacterium]|nr:CxxxxCH/CxxCH domain-containing protein [bacterium]